MPADFRINPPEDQSHLEYAPSSEEDELPGDEGMSVQKRRLFFLAAVVLIAAFIFAWNVFLNFGKIIMKAEPPYSVLIFNEKQYECTENPCMIKLKRGEKSLSFFKLGYKTEGKTIEVPLWDSIEINPIFELEPYIQEIEKIGESSFLTANIQYKIEYDKTHHNWKLFKADDKSHRGLSYFPEKLDNPLVFGSNSAVLIIEDSAIYFVDLKTGERNTIAANQEFKITAAKPSLDGKYFLTDTMMIASKDELTILSTPEAFTTSLWTPFNKLIVVAGDLVVLYDPETGSAIPKTLIDSLKLEGNLSSVTVSPTSKKVYLESSSKKYQVVY